MNSEYELKVLGLIGSLKNEIDNLKEEVTNLKRIIEENEQQVVTQTERISINEIRNHIKKQLISFNPNLHFTNGNRSIGKLTIAEGNSLIEKVLIRTSKSFREKEGYPSGWITVHKELIDKYELFLFVIKDFEDELHILVMNDVDMADWANHKLVDSNGNYHFYINLIHGKWIDDREEDYDCSMFYNNWTTVQELLIGKPDNHRKPWSEEDARKIEEISKNIHTREELEKVAVERAREFGRTHVALAKQIELSKGWHYRQNGEID